MKIVNEKLVFPNLASTESKNIISTLGNAMKKTGFVKESYVSAVLERESTLPTGLQAGKFGVAIPHTDPEHVIESAIGVATLAEPVTFQSMVDPETPITVSLVFLLAIKNSDRQVNTLQKLMSILQDEKMIEAILKAEQPNEIVQLLS